MGTSCAGGTAAPGLCQGAPQRGLGGLGPAGHGGSHRQSEGNETWQMPGVAGWWWQVGGWLSLIG